MKRPATYATKYYGIFRAAMRRRDITAIVFTVLEGQFCVYFSMVIGRHSSMVLYRMLSEEDYRGILAYLRKKGKRDTTKALQVAVESIEETLPPDLEEAMMDQALYIIHGRDRGEVMTTFIAKFKNKRGGENAVLTLFMRSNLSQD